MNNVSDVVELKRRYDEIAETLDEKTTACDYNLRELEIDTAAGYMKDGQRTLDIGCGLGYAVRQYAARKKIEAHGIDYSEKMIEAARELSRNNQEDLKGTVNFQTANVLELPYEDGYFDVVSSSRCLMALLAWELQRRALVEVARVLKPGGTLVLMEGTFEGLDKLNYVREQFNLAPIAADGRDRLFTLKFHEPELLDFCQSLYDCERIQRFGMYYFITRVIHPLMVAPEAPKYSHKINEVARDIARVIPDFDELGHLVAFVLKKKG